MDDEPVYLEHQIVGKQSKMTAIDPKTGLEVVVFGPLKALRNDLQKLAVRKLKKRLADVEKTRNAASSNGDHDTDDRPGRLA